jgi:hypothetical protein
VQESDAAAEAHDSADSRLGRRLCVNWNPVRTRVACCAPEGVELQGDSSGRPKGVTSLCLRNTRIRMVYYACKQLINNELITMSNVERAINLREILRPGTPDNSTLTI